MNYLSLIAAVSANHVIGHANNLPWHIPEDLEYFKRLTKGKIVLMGRKTWESIPEKFRPLPKRKNIVITRQPNYAVPAGVEVFASIDEALAAHAGEEIVVIGGGEIYCQTIDRADTLYITHIRREFAGDAFFPAIDPTIWQEAAREDHGWFSFVTYKRV